MVVVVVAMVVVVAAAATVAVVVVVLVVVVFVVFVVVEDFDQLKDGRLKSERDAGELARLSRLPGFYHHDTPVRTKVHVSVRTCVPSRTVHMYVHLFIII